MTELFHDFCRKLQEFFVILLLQILEETMKKLRHDESRAGAM